MTFLNLALAAYVAAQLADVVTTRQALSRGGREGNPLIAALMRRLGSTGWILAKLAAAAVAAALLYAQGWTWALLALAAITGAVAWRNTTRAR